MRESVCLTHMSSRNLPERVRVFPNFIGRDDFLLPTCDILRQTETTLPLLTSRRKAETTEF